MNSESLENAEVNLFLNLLLFHNYLGAIFS